MTDTNPTTTKPSDILIAAKKLIEKHGKYDPNNASHRLYGGRQTHCMITAISEASEGGSKRRLRTFQ